MLQIPTNYVHNGNGEFFMDNDSEDGATRIDLEDEQDDTQQVLNIIVSGNYHLTFCDACLFLSSEPISSSKEAIDYDSVHQKLIALFGKVTADDLLHIIHVSDQGMFTALSNHEDLITEEHRLLEKDPSPPKPRSRRDSWYDNRYGNGGPRSAFRKPVRITKR